MSTTYFLHILAGGAGLAAGYVALFAAKGGAAHRASGRVFVYAMLVMCAAGAAMAMLRDVAPSINVPAAVLTAYLVTTSLLTVRPVKAASHWLDAGLMLVALTIGLASLSFGVEAIRSASGRGPDGMPAFPFLMFGVVGTLAGVLDLRMMLAGGLTGASRIARHLWRMSFALFIAALSFFIGQADEFPRAIRIMPLLALPVVAVLVTMLYWLWRVRFRRTFRAVPRVPATG